MGKEATFGELIDMCNKVGWDKGIQELEAIVMRTEDVQASLFAGDRDQQSQAQKLSKVIIAQNLTIAKLKKYRSEHQ